MTVRVPSPQSDWTLHASWARPKSKAEVPSPVGAPWAKWEGLLVRVPSPKSGIPSLDRVWSPKSLVPKSEVRVRLV